MRFFHIQFNQKDNNWRRNERHTKKCDRTRNRMNKNDNSEKNKRDKQ